jgi:hypothetical protein
MKKTLLALALSVAALGAAAHPSNRVHYHNQNGVNYSRVIPPDVDVTFETDARGRRVRVETTTTCVQTRVNRRNNHLRCIDEDVTVRRTFVEDRPIIDPVVYRHVERDNQGRRLIVITTYTCTDARWSPDRTTALCFNWDEHVEYEVVRRQPGSLSMDLDGNGRVEPWERLVFRAFREVLDD